MDNYINVNSPILAYVRISICFTEKETSAYNSAPGKNLLNDEHWINPNQADGNGVEDNNSNDPTLFRLLWSFWLRDPFATENYLFCVEFRRPKHTVYER